MSDQTKRILLIILFVVVAIGGALALYFVFFRQAPAEEVVSTEGLTEEEVLQQLLPDIDLGEIDRIAEEEEAIPEAERIPTIASGEETLVNSVIGEEVEAFDVDDTGNIRYYNPEDGSFYRLDSQGNFIKLSDEVFNGVESVTWNGESDEAIIEFPDGSNVLYDFSTDEQYTLPEDMEEFGFNNSGDKIAYKFNSDDPDSRWLGVANPDGSGTEGINFLGENGDIVDVNWSPDNTVIGTYTRASGTDQTTVGFLGLNNENFKGMIVEGRGFEGIWSPDGKRMLYSAYNGDSNYNPVLWIADAQGENIGENRTNLGLQTWASKCVFTSGGTTVYCGVPDVLPAGSGLVPSNADDSPYSIYEINLNSGAMSRVAIPTDVGGGSYAIDSLYVDDAETTLYFREATSGQVYSILLQ